MFVTVISAGIGVQDVSLLAWLAAIFLGFELTNKFKSPAFLATPYVVIFIIALIFLEMDLGGLGFLIGMISFTIAIQWFGRE